MAKKPTAAETNAPPAPADLEGLHLVDEIAGADLIPYSDPEGAGWAGWYEDEDGNVIGWQALDGTILVPDEDNPDGAGDPASSAAAEKAEKVNRARTKRADKAPAVKKGDQVQFLFLGPRLRSCAARVMKVRKDGRLDLEIAPNGKGKPALRESIPWGDGKTADTWN